MIKRWKESLAVLITVSFFIVVSFLTNKYGYSLRLFVDNFDWYFGVIIYFVISIFAFVFAPLNSVALVPVAVSLWGPLNAGIVVHLAGTVGCVITYALSATYGLPFVKRFISDEDIYDITTYWIGMTSKIRKIKKSIDIFKEEDRLFKKKHKFKF